MCNKLTTARERAIYYSANKNTAENRVAQQSKGDTCMPTYEYHCKSCNHRFETVQKMTDEPLTICPECGGYIRRALFPAGLPFQASRLYKTRPRNSSPGKQKSQTPK